MMKHIETSEYYVAYFDVLGYQEYFKKDKDASQKFIDNLCSAIDDTIGVINNMTSSKMLSELANIKIQQRIFSDNVLVCLKKGASSLEPIRILSFLQTIIDIQRKFVLDYGILLRGGISVGPLFIDQSHLVGEILIKVVSMEHAVKHPFIALDDAVTDVLTKSIAEYSNNQSLQYVVNWIEGVIFRFEGIAFKTLDYLNYITVQDIWPVIKGNEEQLVKILSGQYNGNTEQVYQNIYQNKDDMQYRVLSRHRKILEQLMADFCNYDEIDFRDEKKILEREKIIMKYKWIWTYHNTKCAQVNRKDLILNAIMTYDDRIMRDIIRIPLEKNDDMNNA